MASSDLLFILVYYSSSVVLSERIDAARSTEQYSPAAVDDKKREREKTTAVGLGSRAGSNATVEVKPAVRLFLTLTCSTPKTKFF